MYENETILELKEPREPDEETGEEFPYNRVRVVGRSPVNHTEKFNFTGADAVGVIIVPLTNFGSTLDEPFGRLRDLYTVVETPVREIPAQTIRVIDSSSAAAGPTPEEIFAEEAPGVPPEPGQTRGRTNPFGDEGAKPDPSPLSKPRAKRAPKAAE